jgi:3-oxoacyl-[acyl-carrier-protein] synthase-3
MSAATVPVALVEALEDGRVPPHSLMLMPAFGGGLTWCAHLVRFGARTTPIDTADVELPPCGETALDLVNALRARKVNRARSQAGLASPIFPETQVILAGANAVA